VSEASPVVESASTRWMTPGAPATWIHVPRGGYGYQVPVDATILKLHGKTCTIEVTTRAGTKVKRRVSVENLRVR